MSRGCVQWRVGIVLGLCGIVLPAQIQSLVLPLGQGTWPTAGSCAVNGATVVLQTVGSDGFRRTLDDSITVVRDLGGAPQVFHLPAGVMVDGLLDLGAGAVAALVSGVDGFVGTADDGIFLVRGLAGPTPSTTLIPLPGRFVGPPVPTAQARLRDYLEVGEPGQILFNLDGATLGTPVGGGVIGVLHTAGTPGFEIIPCGLPLHHGPCVLLSPNGAAHWVVGTFGPGADGLAGTSDDLVVVVDRVSSQPYRVRTIAAGAGLLDGGLRSLRPFTEDIAVALGVIGLDLGAVVSNGSFDPPYGITFQQELVVVRNLANPWAPLIVDLVHVSDEARWVPPAPMVNGSSVWMCVQDTYWRRMVEVTDLVSSRTPPVSSFYWAFGFRDEPKVVFYGTGIPASVAYNGVLTTLDPQALPLRGWPLQGSLGSDVVRLNDGVLVQAGVQSLKFVENVAYGAVVRQAAVPGFPLLPQTLGRLSGGSVYIVGAGPDLVSPSSDDHLVVWTGLPGITALGLGDPTRGDGGPSLFLEDDAYYPRASSTGWVAVHYDAGSSGLWGAWTPGYLVATPEPGFIPLAHGRAFLNSIDLPTLTVLDEQAGVSSTGRGSSFVALPGRAELVGHQTALQWLVWDTTSPTGLATSNGLSVTYGR